MQFSTSLILLASAITGTLHKVAVSATPYSRTELHHSSFPHSLEKRSNLQSHNSDSGGELDPSNVSMIAKANEIKEKLGTEEWLAINKRVVDWMSKGLGFDARMGGDWE
ncbi:hypothetical protein BC835DRAFT_1306441 [Cytidiella melzeri]|nr:hypothetical protein BC835DRAFT_1306441 [Cytidiella melzeri]